MATAPDSRAHTARKPSRTPRHKSSAHDKREFLDKLAPELRKTVEALQKLYRKK